jgi:large subunit ribosomal protein L54
MDAVQQVVEETIPRIEIPVGSPIKNIVVHAGRPDPIALPDDQYPEWMWQIVRVDAASESSPDESVQPDKDAIRRKLRKESKVKIRENNSTSS